jgi:hypothetical protein
MLRHQPAKRHAKIAAPVAPTRGQLFRQRTEGQRGKLACLVLGELRVSDERTFQFF